MTFQLFAINPNDFVNATIDVIKYLNKEGNKLVR